MALVFTFELAIGIFTFPILAAVSVISFYRFFKQKQFHLLFLALDWGGMAFWNFFTHLTTFIALNIEDFSNLIGFEVEFISTYATLVGLIAYLSLIPTTLFLLLFVELVNRTSIDPIKIAIFTLISWVVLVTALEGTIAVKDVTIGVYWAAATLYTFRSLLYFYYAVRLYINSPDRLRSFAFMILVGVILMGIIPSFNILTVFVPPGAGPNELLFLIGIALMLIPFAIRPQLLFLLPYKTSRLAVLSDEGTLLFSHQWMSSSDDTINEMFFSEKVVGLSSLLKESIQHEKVHQIHIEESIMVITRHRNFSFVLITMKTSKSLLNALNSFSENFVQKFDELLAKDIIEPKDYRAASTLITECFPYVPEYT
ncbi:MAG: hypothetical protein ACXACK_12900 [Candidatus Hodarchaeales archaeon]|jgi:hypothetical protein